MNALKITLFMLDFLVIIQKPKYYDKKHIHAIVLILGQLKLLFILGINYFAE